MAVIITGNEGDDVITLCPELATPTMIITKDNMASLQLSNYTRTPGTTVQITCLSHPYYRLVGPGQLTCQPSGQWDSDPPFCLPDESTSGGEADNGIFIRMVLAGWVSLFLLAVACVMAYVTFCWSQKKKKSRAHGFSATPPISLLRSLNSHDAGSSFSQQRRHHHHHHHHPGNYDATTSECSDVIESVSVHGVASNTVSMNPQSPVPGTSRRTFSEDLEETLGRSSPITYITGISRDTGQPRRTRSFVSEMPSTTRHAPAGRSDSLSRASPTTCVTALSKGTQPSIKYRVGTGQPYRSWHELFYSSSFS